MTRLYLLFHSLERRRKYLDREKTRRHLPCLRTVSNTTSACLLARVFNLFISVSTEMVVIMFWLLQFA